MASLYRFRLKLPYGYLILAGKVLYVAVGVLAPRPSPIMGLDCGDYGCHHQNHRLYSYGGSPPASSVTGASRPMSQSRTLS